MSSSKYQYHLFQNLFSSLFFKAPIEAPGQIASGDDMDMIKSYGGPGENQQSSTMPGGNIIEFFFKVP